MYIPFVIFCHVLIISNLRLLSRYDFFFIRLYSAGEMPKRSEKVR